MITRDTEWQTCDACQHRKAVTRETIRCDACGFETNAPERSWLYFTVFLALQNDNQRTFVYHACGWGCAAAALRLARQHPVPWDFITLPYIEAEDRNQPGFAFQPLPPPPTDHYSD